MPYTKNLREKMELATSPLADVRVLDLTQMWAGPLATMHLGDLGAEVVKIENPSGGELTRHYEPSVGDISGYFAALNRNKESLTLDLSDDEGQTIFLELVEAADVVVENFKPGTVERFGISYQDVSAVNDSIIYCSIKGFARNSRYEDLLAFDMVIQAMGGSMSITGEEDGPPLRTNVPIGDIAAGMYANQAILAKLFDREVNDGGGTYLEVPMLDALLSWLGPRITHSLFTGTAYPRKGNAHTEFAPYNSFETASSHIVVCVATENIWPDFCQALGREDLIEDERFETNDRRVENEEALYDILSTEFASKSSEDWFEILRAHDVPVAPVNDTLQISKDPYVQDRGLIDEFEVDSSEDTIPVVQYPVEFADGVSSDTTPPPGLGTSSERFLADLGWSREKILTLRENGVI